VIERIDGVSITDQLPTNYPQTAQSVNELGQQLTDELARLHNIDPAAVGLSDFGNPTDFLSRNIDRWLHIRSQEAVRDLPDIERLGLWLRAHLPAISSPSLTHGDFHIDNTLCSPNRPVLEAIIDWELATLGDPLTDLGLFLMFWGPRSEDPPAFRHIQAVSRVSGALSRQQLAAHWSSLTGRSISELPFYLCFAFWRLACIVEGAWILQATGKVDTAYARGLEYDVPALLREAHRASQGDW
jgi:aminoglycoside phosphotransferase (APT) family kinase protein